MSLTLPGELTDPAGAANDRPATAQTLSVSFQGTKGAAAIQPASPLPGVANFLTGSTRAEWKTNLPTYAGLAYDELYPGIDLSYAGSAGALKSTYTVAPGADPALIRWRYEGAADARVAPDGSMSILLGDGRADTPAPAISESAPVAWQERDGRRQPVEVAYRHLGDGGFGFSVGAYDRSLPLIIDPLLTYSATIGGANQDSAQAIAFGSGGAKYVAGHTQSRGFPTATPYQSAAGGGTDVFVAKFSAAGALVYSTYLGGSGNDLAGGIAVDASGNAHIIGTTDSSNFPTQNPRQAAKAGLADAFVTKLNANGNGLLYSTYLGGSANDGGSAIGLDASGNALLAGYTESTNFPTQSPGQAANGGGRDLFIAKLASGGATLSYSTYWGGSAADTGAAIAVDSNGSAYVAGWTDSANFPLAFAYQSILRGTRDAVLLTLGPGGLVSFSTYFGGSDIDQAHGVAVDSSGSMYLGGMTTSSNMPRQSAYQFSFGGVADGFVAKFTVGSKGAIGLGFSTYLGGSGDDRVLGLALYSGTPWITGSTQSANFPVLGAYQAAKAGGADAFIANFSAPGQLLQSTYYGGAGDESGLAIAVASVSMSVRVAIAGATTSANLPTLQAIQTSYQGGGDGFVAELALISNSLAHATYLGGAGAETGRAAAVDAGGNAYVVGHTDSAAFPTAGPAQAALGGKTDVFVTKLNPAGTAAVYSTYLGGANDDLGFGIAVDGSGNAILTGYTDSTNFPVQSAHQAASGGGRDLFVAKLNAAGNGLVYSTYLGGAGSDAGTAVALSSAGVAYVAGWSSSLNFPLVSPSQNVRFGKQDAVLARLSTTGQVNYSTYLGGGDFDEGRAVGVDGAGNMYIAGWTTSSETLADPAFQPSPGGESDGFAIKLSSTGALLYHTYLGGAGNDEINGLAVTGAGEAIVAGSTQSANFPISDSTVFQVTKAAGADAFVTKLTSDGREIHFSTFLGGAGEDQAHGVRLDSAQNVMVAGATTSANFPLARAMQTSLGGATDAFASVLSPTGTALRFSTYLGGAGVDAAYGLAVDASRNIVLTGATASANFPTLPATGASVNGSDVFITKLDPHPPEAPAALQVAAATTSTLTLSWSPAVDNTATTGYNVYRNGALIGQPATPGFLLTGLSPHTTYPITVTARDAAGHVSPASATLNAVTANTSPVAALSVAPSSGPAPLAVALTATASDAEQDSLSYLWDFGHGDVLLIGGPTANYTYPSQGVYTAKVTVSDPFGGVAVATVTITATNAPPSAALSATPDEGPAALTTTLTLAASDPTDDPLTATWDFGDGTGIVGGLSHSHVYARAGVYTPTVTVQDPGGLAASASAVVRVLPPLVRWSAPAYAGSERDGAALLTATLSYPAAVTATVTYRTISDTATPGADYAPVVGTLTFAPGQTVANAAVTLVDDGLREADEQLTVALADPVNLTVGGPDIAVVTILDASPLPVVRWDSPLGIAPEADATATLTATLSAPSSAPVTVAYATVADSALPGDYVPVSDTLVFAPGVVTATLEIALLDDSENEADERLIVRLSDPAGAALDVAELRDAFVQIVDDEVPVLNPPPAANPAAPTDPVSSTAFLYEGSAPIQTGVPTGTIVYTRGAVLRGQVVDGAGQPLPGVQISILDHPEFGQTESRADGMLDMAVNGGGLLTVVYEKAGYLPAQRTIDVPWRDFAWLPEVALLPLDQQVTPIDLHDPETPRVAQGAPVNDGDGERQSTVFFPSTVTSATATLADGSQVELSSLHVRATEYTVGERGPAAMPGALPANSGYTYAVEMSIDEVQALGATTVEFNQPLINYTENFLDFPVGTIVPTGYYDRERAAWVASDNGVVMMVLAATDGLAGVDYTGDGIADDGAAWRITDEERAALAELYAPGTELWRVEMPHFTPWDHNWPYGPPAGSGPPPDQPPSGEDPEDPNCYGHGSVIGCQKQTLGEVLPIDGAPFQLAYQSDRVPGRETARALKIPVTGAPLAAEPTAIKVEMTIAGQRIEQTLTDWEPNQHVTLTWDGSDAYGRPVQGALPAEVNVTYVYPAEYKTPGEFDQSFGQFGTGTAIGRSSDRSSVEIGKTWKNQLGGLNAADQGLGGWTLDIYHSYDSDSRTLFLGNGKQRTADTVSRAISTLAGGDYQPQPGDGLPATGAPLYWPNDVAFGADGSAYIADRFNRRVRRIDASGVITTVAGTDDWEAPTGDGGLATESYLHEPVAVALDGDGILFIADESNNCVRKVAPDGIITTAVGFCGDPQEAPPGTTLLDGPRDLAFGADGALYVVNGNANEVLRVVDGVATQAAQVDYPTSVAVAADGTLYVSTWDNIVVRQAPGGAPETIAGTGVAGFSGDGGLAESAQLYSPSALLLDATQSTLYIADSGNQRIRSVDLATGIITTTAGVSWTINQERLLGDGGPATAAKLDWPTGLAQGADGALYLADKDNNRVRRIGADGVITTVAGTGQGGYADQWGDYGPAAKARFDFITALTPAPDGSLYVLADGRVRRIGADGIITTVAGGGDCLGCDGPAREIEIESRSWALALGPDGSLYIGGDQFIVRIGADGWATTIARSPTEDPLEIRALAVNAAGDVYYTRGFVSGIYQLQPDGSGLRIAGKHYWPQADPAPAAEASLYSVSAMAFGLDGSLYLVDSDHVVRQLGSDGIVRTIAGLRNNHGYNGDGHPALETQFAAPSDLAFLPEGGYYLADTSNNRIRLVGENGIVSTIAGNGVEGDAGDGGSPTAAELHQPDNIAVGPDGRLFIGSNYGSMARIRVVAPSLPGVAMDETSVPSEDGRELYVFDRAGRHLRTMDTTTGAPLYQFGYDAEQRLASVTDAFSRTTALAYGDGAVTVTAPGGEQSTLALDENGYLASLENPLGHATSFTHDQDGLLTAMQRPGQGAYAFEYDELGRLEKDTDPTGSAKTLTRIEHARGYTTTFAVGSAPPTIFGVETLPTGDRREITIDEQGNRTERLRAADGTITVTAPDGAVLTATEQPDPRFGMQATTVSGIQLVSADGQTSELSAQRDTSQTSADDLLAFGVQSDTVVVNGRASTTTLDAATNTLTETNHLGVSTVTRTNARGQLVEERRPGQQPVFYEYDERGRLLATRQGPQVWTYAYDSRDRLITSTNPLSERMGYRYDAAGNLTSEIMPDGRTTVYGYNPAGLRELVVEAAGTSDAITTTYGFDAAGRVLTTTVGLGTALARVDVTAYNADETIKHTILNFKDGVFDPAIPDEDVRTTYGYDAAGRPSWSRTSGNDSYGRVTHYTALGKVDWVVDNPRDATGAPFVPTPATLRPYDPARPSENILTRYAYDGLGRTTLITETGHLAGEPQVIGGVPVWPAAPPLVTRMDYDLYHPISVTRNFRPEIPASALDSSANVQSFTAYNEAGDLAEVTDALGRRTLIDYDALRRPITTTVNLDDGDPLTDPGTDRIAVTRYDAAGRAFETIQNYVDGAWDPAKPDQDRVTRRSYDALGRVITTTVNVVDGVSSPAEPATDLLSAVGYSPIGTVVTATDALGRRAVTQYNQLAQPIAHIRNYQDGDPRSAPAADADVTTRLAYDPLGRLRDQWAAPSPELGLPGVRTRLAYDALGRIRQTIANYDPSQPAGAVFNLAETQTYDALGQLAQLENARGVTTTLGYDGRGQQISSEVAGSGRIVAQGYDGRGALRWTRDERGVLTVYQLDALGRAVETIQNYEDGLAVLAEPDRDLITRTIFDRAGRPHAEIDANGTATMLFYDAGDRIAKVVQNFTGFGTWDPEIPDRNVPTVLGYDLAGNLTEIQRADGGVWTRGYDARDRLVRTTDPLGAAVTYGYDRAGNQIRTTNARGQVIASRYDGLDRLVAQTYPDVRNNNQPITTTWSYAASGQRLAMADSHGVTRYGYDALLRTTAITDVTAATAPITRVVGYAYDALGNRTALAYPDGAVLRYGYDAWDRLAVVSDTARPLVSYGYDAAGRLTSAAARISTGVTLTASYGYDDADRITAITYLTGTVPIGQLGYAYDAAGNRTVITETFATPDQLVTSRVLSATYDELTRLVDATGSDGSAWSYAYDGRGNRLSSSATLTATTTTVAHDFDPADRVADAAWRYDADGNVLTDGELFYAYDAFGRTIGVTDTGGLAVAFGYNGDGVRVWQEVNGVRTAYVNDLAGGLSQVLQEETGGTVTPYRYGLGLLGTDETWHVTDAQGTVRQLVGSDGAVAGVQAFDPFGTPLTAQVGAVGYAGEWQDPRTTLVNLRARWYHPGHGTFLSRDPARGAPKTPYSLHPYQYGYSNPFLHTDPSGWCPEYMSPLGCPFYDELPETAQEVLDALPQWIQILQDGYREIPMPILQVISLVADFSPVIGDIKGLIEVFTGCDLITGEKLGWWRFAGLIPLIGTEIRGATRLPKLREILPAARKAMGLADDVLPHLDDVPPHLPHGPDGPPKLPEDPGGPPKLPTCSFSADTVVATNHGPQPIGALEVGDSAWAYNEADGTTGLYSITAVLVHEDPVLVHLAIEDEPIATTPEHPFFTAERGWVPAGDLAPGEHVRRLDGTLGAITDLRIEQRAQVMYNLTVATAHTFFVGAGEWLVHNDCLEFSKKLDNGAHITSNVDSTGIFWLAIEVPEAYKGQGVGSGLFKEAWDKIGGNANAIGGKWVPSMPDNLNSFNDEIRKLGKPLWQVTESDLKVAASRTFTGKMATRRGFTNITFYDLAGNVGEYTNVEVVFR
ncbi:MAG TPA: SBBP repeat-containing protein [Herpetosiphonaceae bacterium]